MASWTHTLGSTALNELRAGYYRLNFADVEPTHVVQPSSYGFNISPQSPMANLPLISVSGLNGNTASGIAGGFLGFTNEGHNRVRMRTSAQRITSAKLSVTTP